MGSDLLDSMHGVELVRAVIERVNTEGLGLIGGFGTPEPMSEERLAALRLPNGAELPPSLREWLACDASFLDWFSDPSQPALPAMNLGAAALESYGEIPPARDFALVAKTVLTSPCLRLPRGKVVKRFLYLGKPDSQGEYPVIATDASEPPFVCIDQPGFDVYLATLAGILHPPKRVLGSFVDDEIYGARMREHIEALGGQSALKLGDEGFEREVKIEVDPAALVMLRPGEPIPEDYVVVESVMMPLADVPIRFVAPKSAVRERTPDE